MGEANGLWQMSARGPWQCSPAFSDSLQWWVVVALSSAGAAGGGEMLLTLASRGRWETKPASPTSGQ